jgi:WD40 repeat protein
MTSDGNNGEHVDLIRAAMSELSSEDVVPGSTSEVISFAEAPGQVIDRYRLLEEIGEGGMGVVWRAQQLAPVERVVALKVVKRGMDTRQVVARFELERAALAQLSHPNIATVLDGGQTAGGRPYFAMEYVPGSPMVEASDQMRLDVRARVQLMVAVCAAIEHAHGKGIIHRDIKSSNVLLPKYADHESIGQALSPKVIDFGIAKAVEGERDLTGLLTGDQQIIGTIETMAPEQAAMGAVDARTDVYALGALLCELMSGATPFGNLGLAAVGYEQMLRSIRLTRPPLASTLACDEVAASDRSATVNELQKSLRRDMDWVIARSLEKEPERRYPSVADLRLDLERYLDGHPVEARPPSVGYRMAKFVLRHRGLTAGVSAAMLALIVGLIGTGLSLRRARSAEADALRTLYYAESLLACDAAGSPGGSARVSELCAHWREPLSDSQDWRGWEWDYLNSTTRPDVQVIVSPTVPCGVDWHPDGERIAVSRHGAVDVYNSRNGRRLGGMAPLEGDDSWLFEGVSWSPKGDLVAAAGLGGVVVLNPAEEEVLWTYAAGYISGPAWDPSGSKLIGYGIEGDQGDLMFELDAASGELLQRASGGYQWMGSFEFSADGRWLPSAKSIGKCVVLSATSYEPLFVLSDHLSVLTAARWNGDDTALATAGFDGRVRIWDVASRSVRTAIDGLREPIRGLDWHPDGRSIATSCDNKQINVWDAQTGEQQAELSAHGRRVDRVAWSPSGDRLASTSQDGTIRVWNMGTPAPHRSFASVKSEERAPRTTLSWLPGEQSLLVSSALGAVVASLDGVSGRPIQPTVDRNNGAVSAGGNLVATSSDAAGGSTVELRVWDSTLAAPALHEWTFDWQSGHNRVILAWHPSRPQLAFAYGGTLRVVELPSGGPPVEVYSTPLEKPLESLDWDPAGERLAAVGAGDEVVVLSLKAETTRISLDLLESRLSDVDWSHDGQRLAVCSTDGDVALMNADGSDVQLLAGHSSSAEAIRWHPSGRRIASASRDGTVFLWDTETGQLAAKLVDGDPVLALAWDSAGTRLAAVTDLGLVHVWDASISQEQSATARR